MINWAMAHFDYFTSAHREPAAVLPCQLELCSLFFGSFKQVYLSEAVTWGWWLSVVGELDSWQAVPSGWTLAAQRSHSVGWILQCFVDSVKCCSVTENLNRLLLISIKKRYVIGPCLIPMITIYLWNSSRYFTFYK